MLMKCDEMLAVKAAWKQAAKAGTNEAAKLLQRQL
jgi:hypothetical protein